MLICCTSLKWRNKYIPVQNLISLSLIKPFHIPILHGRSRLYKLEGSLSFDIHQSVSLKAINSSTLSTLICSCRPLQSWSSSRTRMILWEGGPVAIPICNISRLKLSTILSDLNLLRCEAVTHKIHRPSFVGPLGITTVCFTHVGSLLLLFLLILRFKKTINSVNPFVILFITYFSKPLIQPPKTVTRIFFSSADKVAMNSI